MLESGQYVMGPMLSRFEKELAAYFGTKYAIGVGNGTDAIWLTLMALGVGPGDECITTTNTFFATAEAIWIAGAKVVFVDCDPKPRNIDPKKIEKAINKTLIDGWNFEGMHFAMRDSSRRPVMAFLMFTRDVHE